MILRKPYAFFIKHFKLIHLLLAALMLYSLYRIRMILSFLNESVSINVRVIGQDLMGTYLYGFIYLVPIIVIALSITIMVVMIVKKKPSFFYLINIVIYLYALIILLVTSTTLGSMETTLLDARVTRLVRDLNTVSFVSQIFSFIIVFIRAIGFDIKKFDFKRDLQELKIEEADSEEFEFEIKFNKNKFIRGLRRYWRYLKYAYKENKLVANIILSICLIIVGYFGYNQYQSRQIYLNQNQFFSGNNLSLSITDSYLTNTDYQGNIIDNNYYYLMLRIKIKSNKENNILDTATSKIVIGKYVYTPSLDKREKLFDFGNIYNDEAIKTDYEIKTLIYEIPKQLIDRNIIFSYVKKNAVGKELKYNDTKIRIKYNDLTKNKETKVYNLNENIDFNGIFNNYKIIMNNYSIASIFKIDYKYCILKDCYSSYEYIKPSLTSNYDKSILKIKGSLTVGDVNITGIDDLYDFIDKFGKIKYTINNEEKIQNINFKEILSKKVNKTDNYYIEILKEINNADKVSIIFTLRNESFEYILK